jgi:hypothetical protein
MRSKAALVLAVALSFGACASQETTHEQRTATVAANLEREAAGSGRPANPEGGAR